MKQTTYWKYKRRRYILAYGMRAWLKYLAARRLRKFKRTAKGRYAQHKEHARVRGIVWEFTFVSWRAMWERSGHWNERGNKRGQYVMARRGDTGSYSENNCIIVKSEVNAYAQGIQSTHFPRTANSNYSDEVSAIL